MRVRVATCVVCGVQWHVPVKRGPAPRHCPAHRARSHGKRKAKYGASHQRLRKQVAEQVAAGVAICWRPHCRKLIKPWEPWDLGHDDHNPNLYRGPEHRACNRGAAARKKNAGLYAINANSRAW